jgi:FtsH-binding integral membrane protein
MSMDNNGILSNAFKWLAIGLLVCFATSYICSMDEVFEVIFGAGFAAVIVFVVLELACAFALTLFIKKLSPTVAKVLYILYTVLTGISFSGIFLVYTGESIAMVFLMTGLIFGAFAWVGKNSKMDLSKWGTYLFVALIAIIITEIINIFIGSSGLQMLICLVAILVFAGYTAYDVKFALERAKDMDTENAGIFCAFQLFLDFINLFIRLLELFGKNND